MTLMWLQRCGAMTWEALRKDLTETASDCAWTDFAGFHFTAADALPERIPSATHLWAWDSTRAVRVRVDVDRTLVAALHTVRPDGPATEEIRVRERTGHPWSTADRHVGRAEVPLPQEPFTLLEPAGTVPVVFIRRP